MPLICKDGYTHTRLYLHWVEHYIFSKAVHTDMPITFLGLDDLQVTVGVSFGHIRDRLMDTHLLVHHLIEDVWRQR